MLIKTISIPLLLATATFFSACLSDLPNKTPKCSDLAVMDTLSKILSTDSKKATVDIETVRKKLDLTEQNGQRTCRARVDYLYSVSGMIENDKVVYTVFSSETEKKYTVSVVEE